MLESSCLEILFLCKCYYIKCYCTLAAEPEANNSRGTNCSLSVTFDVWNVVFHGVGTDKFSIDSQLMNRLQPLQQMQY